MELGHSDKRFAKNTRNKDPWGKNWEFFLLDTFKTIFWIKNFN